jgi:hypothetical protein
MMTRLGGLGSGARGNSFCGARKSVPIAFRIRLAMKTTARAGEWDRRFLLSTSHSTEPRAALFEYGLTGDSACPTKSRAYRCLARAANHSSKVKSWPQPWEVSGPATPVATVKA